VNCTNTYIPLIESNIDGLKIKSTGTNLNNVGYAGTVLKLNAPATYEPDAATRTLRLRSLQGAAVVLTCDNALTVKNGILDAQGATYGIMGSKVTSPTTVYNGTFNMEGGKVLSIGNTASVAQLKAFNLNNYAIVAPEGATWSSTAHGVVDTNGNLVAGTTVEVGPKTYDLKVGGLQVTSANCGDILGDGTVTYDPVGNKLILNNVNYNESFNDYFIKNEIDGLQIVVNGENYIGPNVLRGISVGNNAKTTITGGGSLTIDVGQTGVYTCSLLTITGGVQLSSKGTYAYSAYNYAGITISNAMTRVKGYGTKSCLYNVNGLTLNDGLQIVEPEGAHMEGWTMMDADSNILKNTWLVIAKSAAIPGDVDGDGSVTSADITTLYNYLLNGDSSSLVNGDQDGDGSITSGDVTAVYNILLGN
jgi:hypothetical protein